MKKNIEPQVFISHLVLKVNVSNSVRPSVNQKAFNRQSQPSAHHIVGTTTLFHLKLPVIYLGTLKKTICYFFLDNPYGIILFLQHISNIFLLDHSSVKGLLLL